MTRRYARTQPDPELAERNRRYVRNRLRQEAPLFAGAVDSVVAADLPLERAVRDLLRARDQVRAGRSARTRAVR